MDTHIACSSHRDRGRGSLNMHATPPHHHSQAATPPQPPFIGGPIPLHLSGASMTSLVLNGLSIVQRLDSIPSIELRSMQRYLVLHCSTRSTIALHCVSHTVSRQHSTAQHCPNARSFAMGFEIGGLGAAGYSHPGYACCAARTDPLLSLFYSIYFYDHV